MIDWLIISLLNNDLSTYLVIFCSAKNTYPENC